MARQGLEGLWNSELGVSGLGARGEGLGFRSFWAYRAWVGS